MMGKPFGGVWGTFEFLDDTAKAVEALRKQGRDLSVISPCPRHELVEAMGRPVSRIPFITAACGAFGLFFGYGFPSWTALDWVLPVSQKPIIGIPAFTIIGFEMMVLFAGIGTALAILGMGYIDLFLKPMPRSERYTSYNRFSVDRFGVVVRCSEQDAGAVEQLMRTQHADEVLREF